MNVTDINRLLQQLETAPEFVIPLVYELPENLRKRRPGPGVWSAHEHACHLPAVQPLMVARLELMLANDHPVITPYEPSRDDPDDALLSLDLDAEMQRFRRERAELVTRLRTLTPAQWSRTADHAEYSHYSVFIMFRHVALHDLYHGYRIEQRLLNRAWAADWPAR